MIELSPFCRRALRRYSSAKCPRGGIHDVWLVVDDRLEGVDEAVLLKEAVGQDPRWPASCACGYAFQEADHWQVHIDRLWQGTPDGKLYALRDPDLPIGAMWDAKWFKDSWKGPDGLSLVVRMPGGSDFPVDMTLSGESWTRIGTPPQISVHPSVNCVGVYHGHIKNGVISEDVEKRPFAGIPRTA
jgi:hypothetical protein